MNKKPNPFLAGFLCLISPMLGPLYAARGGWAAFYFVATSAAIVTATMSFHRMPIVILLVPALYVASIIHAFLMARAYPEGKMRPHYSRWYGVVGTYLSLVVAVVGFRAFLFDAFVHHSGSMLPAMEADSIVVVQKWGYGHYGSYGVTLLHLPITSELRHGDIVIFERQADSERIAKYAKRVVGLPGDKITYRDKKLSINGREVPQVREGDYVAVRAGKGSQRLMRFAESLDGTNYSVVINEAANWMIMDAPMLKRQKECAYDEHGETCEIPAGHYFVMGDNRDNSNDSRYWGFVSAEQIVGKVVQVY